MIVERLNVFDFKLTIFFEEELLKVTYLLIAIHQNVSLYVGDIQFFIQKDLLSIIMVEYKGEVSLEAYCRVDSIDYTDGIIHFTIESVTHIK